MSLLKQLKWNLILLAVIFIALGIVLILWPGATMKTICYLLAAMLLAIGVVSLINYLHNQDALKPLSTKFCSLYEYVCQSIYEPP